MDSILIQNWNLSALNGKKFLIRGNHDKFTKRFDAYAADVVWIKDYHVLKYQKRKFILFHYPILEWESYGKDSIHLYGHIHNNEKSIERTKVLGKNTYNVGVDVNGYEPVSVEQVLRIIEKQNT